MKQAWIGGALAVVVAAALLPAAEAAAAKKPGKQQAAVIEHRQAQMKQLREAMKTLGGFAKGEVTDVAQARAAAASMSRVGAAMPHLWPAGTAVGVGESNTRATLWRERQAFATRVAEFQTAATALNAAAATGQRAQVAQRLGPVGASCKACHDAWQVKD